MKKSCVLEEKIKGGLEETSSSEERQTLGKIAHQTKKGRGKDYHSHRKQGGYLLYRWWKKSV